MDRQKQNTIYLLKGLDMCRQLVYSNAMKPKDLKAWRSDNGYSQSQLARVLGVDTMTVSRWETGLREPAPYLHLALAHLECIAAKNKKPKRRQG